MKIHTFLLCLFTTFSALSLFAQYPKDYEPVPIYSDFPSYIADHMRAQLSEDLEGIQARGKVKRSLKEVYQARHDQLLENVQNGYYIFDDFLFGYCDAIFSHILDANPQIPRDKVHLILDRSTVPNASSSIWVMQGKPGYVSIWEYFRKEQRLEVRLEQINY